MAQNRPVLKPTAAQVRAQCDRILASKLFALSNRMRAFLNYIVDAQLENQADKLKEFTLGIDVFEKDESFDPSIDSIVRVEASRLRAKLREYYDGDGQNDPIRIDVPKGHYIPTFSFAKQNSASDSPQQMLGVARPEVSTAVSRDKPYLVLVAITVSLLLIFVADKYLFEQASTTNIDDKSVAVLPFLSLSSGEDDAYFADGLTEEILNALAQLPELRVTARTSSFHFKGQDLLVTDIATRLGVAHIVEGSVRRDGNRLRITAQLIRAADHFHLWSQSYDRTLNDVFAVQEDIAESIAEVLDVVLDDAARELMHSAGIQDVEAFISYQKGQEAFVKAHEGTDISELLAVANTHFNRAIEASPGLTKARLMKADLRSHIVFEIAAGFRDEMYSGELEDTLVAVREEYDLAAELSPVGNQRDLVALERLLFSDNWTGLAFRLDKAMRPGNCPRMNWGLLMSYLGWAEQAAAKLRESIACDPLDTSASFQLAWALIWTGDPDAALQSIAEADAKGISHPSLNDGYYWALLASGRVDDSAVRVPEKEETRMDYDRQILLEAFAGDLSLARRMADGYSSDIATDDVTRILIAAAIGERDDANAAAARIDSFPGSAVVLSNAVFHCFCGAPFDLEATPNYKARLDEAGISWPPPTLIEYPAKNW